MGHVGKQAAYLITFSGALLAGSGERGEQGSESAHSSLTQPTANNKGGVGNLEAIKVIKVDFFALLYIVKKERIMYIEILF